MLTSLNENLVTTFKGLKGYLRQKGYKEIREGKFIINSNAKQSRLNLLLVRKGKDYNQALTNLKKEIKNATDMITGKTIEIGILFVENRIIFLRRNTNGLIPTIDVLEKTLDRMTTSFKKQLMKFLDNVKNPDAWKILTDRTSLIDEFYQLFLKARENLMNNIKGIASDKKKVEFANNLMMQLLITWYLQEKGFFDANPRYLVHMFKNHENLGFKNYHDFLINLFTVMNTVPTENIYHVDEKLGKLVITGSVPFLDVDGTITQLQRDVEIPDEVFYIENASKILIQANPKKLSPEEVPILSLLESRDWSDGNIDEFVLGGLLEKIMGTKERKEKGVFYTPKSITRYILTNTIHPYLIDRMQQKFGARYGNLREFFEKDTDIEKYKYLHEILQDLRILDPACGSGHFLETAIEVLIEIYEAFKQRITQLGFDSRAFSILLADENGIVHEESLFSIKNDQEFRLKVKFHVIIPKNIYGVDVQKSAINVARARLFLTLAKHHDPKSRALVRFSNAHFNLRCGDSLIGFVNLLRLGRSTPIEKHATMPRCLNEENLKKSTTARNTRHLIKIPEHLEKYLLKVDEQLNLDVMESLKEMQAVSNQSVNVQVIRKVIEFKRKLTKIMVASLNTPQARELQAVLNQVTRTFNEIFTREFSALLQKKGLLIRNNDLKRIGCFHWMLEYPEAFFELKMGRLVEKDGFDVVIGNPPYVKQEKINHVIKGIDYKATLCHAQYHALGDKTFDLSMYFILRSLQLTRQGGYHAFIITNKWLRARYGQKMRRYLKSTVTILKIIEFNTVKVFHGATVDTMIHVIKKEKPPRDHAIYYHNPRSVDHIEAGGHHVTQADLGEDRWHLIDGNFLEIKRWIEGIGVPLKELGVAIYRGITTGFNKAFVIDEETRAKLVAEDEMSVELIKPLIRGRDIDRYHVSWTRQWIITTFPSKKVSIDAYPAIKAHLLKFKEDLEPRTKGVSTGVRGRKPGTYKWYEIQDTTKYHPALEKPKIISTKATKRPSFVLDMTGSYLLNTSYLLTTDNKMLLGILNSKLLTFYLMHEGSRLSAMFEPKVAELERIPIRLPTRTSPHEMLVDYLSFLHAKNEGTMEQHGDVVKYFDEVINDALIYELYFKEKFHSDGLYPEPTSYLLNEVERHLAPINYDDWIKLHWKKQVEKRLSLQEERKLRRLEQENTRVIQNVHEKLRHSSEVQQWLKKVRSHEWCSIIEQSLQH